MDLQELVPLGKVLKVHGIRGKVKVTPFGETLEQLERGRTVYFRDPEQRWRPLVIEKVQRQPKSLIISFRGVWNRDQAEVLRGKKIYLPVSQLPELEEGEYYYYQLIGLQVIDVHGEVLGKLTEIISTGSNDVYVVKKRDTEVLIPALESVIKEVNLPEKKMVVDIPEGLMD
ncbi:MAG: 16S rRNA processing protein RimM [Deltaproteobacteria bacterium]|nr:MAG: 16S rRNA processing protein RimM [Deltaproteobacteria bacterium]